MLKSRAPTAEEMAAVREQARREQQQLDEELREMRERRVSCVMLGVALQGGIAEANNVKSYQQHVSSSRTCKYSCITTTTARCFHPLCFQIEQSSKLNKYPHN